MIDTKTANSRHLITIILLSSLLIFGHIDKPYAQEPWRSAVAKADWHTMRDRLPPFCQVGSKKNPPFNGPGYKGDMMWGNHLCDSLVKIPICRTYPSKDRTTCLTTMAKSYDYWLNHAKNPDFALRPYLHTGLGRLYMEMGRKTDAITEFKMALKNNPKYLKAYKSIIDAYIKLGDSKNAQLYLDQGMRVKRLKAFKRRQDEIDTLAKKP